MTVHVSQSPPNEAMDIIAGIIFDFSQNNPERLIPYFEHIKFDATVIKTPEDLLPAFLKHYETAEREYNTNRALLDFISWPEGNQRILDLNAQDLSQKK